MSEPHKTLYLSTEQCVDHIVSLFGPDIRIGMPLGLGKPPHLINALYRRAKRDSTLKLTIFTALSLEKPVWSNPLERRFLEPFVERVWDGVPDLDYARDLRLGEVPPNVCVHELFFKAGVHNRNEAMQQDHICTNYTHVVRDCEINGNQIFAHMIAKAEAGGQTVYSASCNADTSLLTLKTFGEAQARGEKRLRIGVVNPQLPFMYGDAAVSAEQYDVIIDEPAGDHPLFSTPRLPVSDGEHMIGLHVSALIRDGGTLQIGIGALGDAIAYALKLRHADNGVYNELLDLQIKPRHAALIDAVGGTAPFEQGLYGSTEMLVDGFLQLYKAGVIKRRVYPHAGVQKLVNEGRAGPRVPPEVLELLLADEALPPWITEKEFTALQRVGVFRAGLRYERGEIVDGARRYGVNLCEPFNLQRIRECLGDRLQGGVVLTGGFFIGPRDFYDDLRAMPDAERHQFEMTGVEVANQLYGNEGLRALQRRDGRFCNTTMKATLLGHMVSDGLESGTVVSGVGGQYNFVAMAHALPDARLIMMLKSTRQEGGRAGSNIVFNYGHVTIPRHLRDIVVTEYGIADLRGRSDAEVVKAMLNIADSRFQAELLAEAKLHHKLPEDYEIPEAYRDNTPERIAAQLQGFKAQGYFSPFPFGSEFDRSEMTLAAALKVLKAKSTQGHEAELAAAMQGLPATPPAQVLPLLQRMKLDRPAHPGEEQMQKAVLLALRLAGVM